MKISAKLLYAIQYNARYPEKQSNSGRRARFDETFLFNASMKIKAVLLNETGGRISLLGFITTYLPIPYYLHDIQTALNNYKINLEEVAFFLALITLRSVMRLTANLPRFAGRYSAAISSAKAHT